MKIRLGARDPERQVLIRKLVKMGEKKERKENPKHCQIQDELLVISS